MMTVTTTLLAILIVGSPTNPPLQAQEAWNQASERRWNPLPQEMPFQYYAITTFKERWKLVGAMALSQIIPPGELPTEEQRQVFNGKSYFKLQGREILTSQNQSHVTFESSQNGVMAAYGYAQWGKILIQKTWIQEARRMANLWVVSPNPPANFNLATLKFEPTNDNDGPATSAFWMAKIQDLDPETTDELAWQKIASIASEQPKTYPQALLCAYLATSPTATQTITKLAKENLSKFSWKTQTKTFKDQIFQIWALSLAAKTDPTLLPQLKQSIKFAWKKEFLQDDPQSPSCPTFGTIAPKPGVIDNDTILAAIALAEAGATLHDPQTLDRAIAAVRSTLNLLRFNLNLPITPAMPELPTTLAYSSYATKAPDTFDPWISFEANEGKILAGLGYMDARFGGTFECAPGQWVGIDGIRSENGVHYDILKNMPQPFLRVSSYRDAVKQDGTRTPLTALNRRPTVVSASLVSLFPKPVIRVLTGGSVSSAEALSNEDKLTITAQFKGSKEKFALIPDQTGFSASIPENLLNQPVTIELRYKDQKSTREFDLNPFTDLSKFEAWTAYGQNASRQKKDGWISTASPNKNDLNSGIGFYVSKPFYSKGQMLTFEIRGAGEAKIILFDPESGDVLLDFLATDSKPYKVEWDLALFANKKLQIQIEDATQSGYIEVKGF